MHPHLNKFRLYYGDYGRSTTQNLFIIIGCLIQGKTVNLYDLKDEVGKISEKCKSKSDSHYRRLTRFFTKSSTSLLWVSILNYGIDLLGKDTRLCYLDGTEWSIGKFNLHCLVLAVDYQGVAMPIYFKIYQHKGVLSQKERISFMELANKFCQLTDSIIIADREFIGESWFANFSALSLHFVIRLRKGQYKNNLIGLSSYLKLEKRALKKGKASSLVIINGLTFRLWVVKNAVRNYGEPLVYILTTILDKRNTPDLYRFRWKIECLFKHLKTNGYNLEDLRMTNLDKIRLLISMVTLAYIIAIVMAFDKRKKEPVKKKYYKNGTSFDVVSVFKQGQSLLKQSFITLGGLLKIIQFLRTTWTVPIPEHYLNVQ